MAQGSLSAQPSRRRANYRIARQRYPVVYLLDGQVRAFFDLTVATTNYDLLGDMHDSAIPSQIVVGIEQGDRGTDLARNGELFTRFIVEELSPYIICGQDGTAATAGAVGG